VTRRRVVTADDVLSVARAGGRELVVAPGDRVTPLARDVAQQHQVRVVEDAGLPARRVGPGAPTRPRLVHVPGASTVALDPFPFPGPPSSMDVRTRDVVTGEHGVPMAAGLMSLREGSFPWTLDYDEVEYVLEGELHLTCGDQVVVARPGDVVAVPRGSSITFGTPSWARFLYVTYPADWGG
jgi:ethanolamine utilization protein EutQ